MERITTSLFADAIGLGPAKKSDNDNKEASLDKSALDRTIATKTITAHAPVLSPGAVNTRAVFAPDGNGSKGAHEVQREYYPQQIEEWERVKRQNLIQACLTKFYASVPPPAQIAYSNNTNKI